MAQVIMIASGKGGTGKSTVATFLASELALKGKKTFLTELDMGLRSIDVISGISDMAVYDIGDVLDGVCSWEKAVVKSPYIANLHIMPAPGKKTGVKFENLKKLVDEIEDMGGVDFSKPVLFGYTGLCDESVSKYVDYCKNIWEGKIDNATYVSVGSVIGTQVGPGAMAIAFFKN